MFLIFGPNNSQKYEIKAPDPLLNAPHESHKCKLPRIYLLTQKLKLLKLAPVSIVIRSIAFEITATVLNLLVSTAITVHVHWFIEPLWVVIDSNAKYQPPFLFICLVIVSINWLSLIVCDRTISARLPPFLSLMLHRLSNYEQQEWMLLHLSSLQCNDDVPSMRDGAH